MAVIYPGGWIVPGCMFDLAGHLRDGQARDPFLWEENRRKEMIWHGVEQTELV